MIRLLIVDDQIIIRQGLKSLLEIQPDLKVIADVANGEEAFKCIDSLQQKSCQLPDVVLLDVRMPIMDGVATTKELSLHYPEIKILILTTFDDDEYISQAMSYGAKGYLLKDTLPEDLVTAIHAVNKGHTYMGAGLFEKISPHFSPSSALTPNIANRLEELSPREQEVLNLIAQGANNREIATKLYISGKTVKNHVTSILSKLHLRDRTQAALLVNQVQLLDSSSGFNT